MAMPIRRLGDPVLREPAKPVESFDRALRRLVDDMLASMYEANGVGLAGPQVGLSYRLFTYDDGETGPLLPREPRGHPPRRRAGPRRGMPVDPRAVLSHRPRGRRPCDGTGREGPPGGDRGRGPARPDLPARDRPSRRRAVHRPARRRGAPRRPQRAAADRDGSRAAPETTARRRGVRAWPHASCTWGTRRGRYRRSRALAEHPDLEVVLVLTRTPRPGSPRDRPRTDARRDRGPSAGPPGRRGRVRARGRGPRSPARCTPRRPRGRRVRRAPHARCPRRGAASAP